MLPVKTRVLEVVCVDPLLLEVGILSLPGLQPQDFLPADEAGYTGRHAPGLEGVVARNVVLVWYWSLWLRDQRWCTKEANTLENLENTAFDLITLKIIPNIRILLFAVYAFHLVTFSRLFHFNCPMFYEVLTWQPTSMLSPCWSITWLQMASAASSTSAWHTLNETRDIILGYQDLNKNNNRDMKNYEILKTQPCLDHTAQVWKNGRS